MFQPRRCHFGVQGGADALADLAGADAHVVDVHEGPVGPDELVVHAEDFHLVVVGAHHDGGAELHVGRADDEPLRLLGMQIVDGGNDFLPVGRADGHDVKTVFFRRLPGELPLVLKPLFFRLLDQEPDLDATGLFGLSGPAPRDQRDNQRESRQFQKRTHGMYSHQCLTGGRL